MKNLNQNTTNQFAGEMFNPMLLSEVLSETSFL
jgi:hypothetical protein